MTPMAGMSLKVDSDCRAEDLGHGHVRCRLFPFKTLCLCGTSGGGIQEAVDGFFVVIFERSQPEHHPCTAHSILKSTPPVGSLLAGKTQQTKPKP